MKIFFFHLILFFSNNCIGQDGTSLFSSDSLRDKTVISSKKDSSHIFCTKSAIKALIIPTSLITYGIIAQGNNGLRKLDRRTQSSIVTNHAGYKTKVDNYLQFTPALAVYGLNIIGIKGKNNFTDRTLIYTLSTLISTATSYSVKSITKVTRPDGSSDNSFPSGHTTTAFAAAEFLRKEYKDISPWYGVAGYLAAATTGALRVYNNKHWVSDVVAGAGFGIISTKLAYWIYPAIKKKIFKSKQMNTAVLPYYQNGVGGFAFIYNFKN